MHPHRATRVGHIDRAEEAADCSKSAAAGAAVHRSTAAADSCRLPRCCSSENPFPEFLIIIFIIIRRLISFRDLLSKAIPINSL